MDVTDSEDEKSTSVENAWRTIIGDAYQRMDNKPEEYHELAKEPHLSEMIEHVTDIVKKVTDLAQELKTDGAYIRIMKKYWKIRGDDSDIESDDAMEDAFIEKKHLIRKIIRQNEDVFEELDNEGSSEDGEEDETCKKDSGRENTDDESEKEDDEMSDTELPELPPIPSYRMY